MTTKIDEARKLDALADRRGSLEADRDAVAFDALASEDAKAVAKLAKINRSLLELDAEAASLGAAIRTGEQREREAQGIERAQIEREKAKSALELGRDLRDQAHAVEKSLKQSFAQIAAMRQVVNELNKLGVRSPSLAVFDSLMRRSLVSLSMGSPLALGHLSPSERHAPIELVERWGAGIQGWAAERLGAPKAEPVKKEAA